MVQLKRDDYEMILPALRGPLRKRLKESAHENSSGVNFVDEIAGEVYDALMEYITQYGFDREYNITPRGRTLELIGDSILDQLGE